MTEREFIAELASIESVEVLRVNERMEDEDRPRRIYMLGYSGRVFGLTDGWVECVDLEEFDTLLTNHLIDIVTGAEPSMTRKGFEQFQAIERDVIGEPDDEPEGSNDPS
ncbi:MAG: hypothetical protein JRL30_00985 [Deltaproteobacteria bacterium]|nr:hypothetical protein [Deltaproteobacteria bacterium]